MGRPTKIWHLTGEVVPPGTLKPNLHNPYYHQTPEERWRGIVSACADIVLRVSQDKARNQLSTLVPGPKQMARSRILVSGPC